MGAFIIIFKMDGEDLNLATRHIGPFPTFDAAYDALGKLPAPVNRGHKYIQQLEAPISEQALPGVAILGSDPSTSHRPRSICRAHLPLRR